MEEEIKNNQNTPGNDNSDESASSADKSQELKKQCDEYLNNWKRSAADFINYKKDEMERAGLLVGYTKEDIIHKILPIFDSFYLAEKEISEEFKNSEWFKGFLQIKKQIEEFLKKEGIEEIKTVGEKFNPEVMEVIEQIEGDKPDMVVEELQKGYKMEEKIIRPAKVKVTK